MRMLTLSPLPVLLFTAVTLPVVFLCLAVMLAPSPFLPFHTIGPSAPPHSNPTCGKASEENSIWFLPIGKWTLFWDLCILVSLAGR